MQERGIHVDPITLVLVVVLIIFFFPLIMRGVGCLIRSLATIILIVVAVALVMQLL